MASGIAAGCHPKDADAPPPAGTWAPQPPPLPPPPPPPPPTATAPATTQGPGATPLDPSATGAAAVALAADSKIDAPGMGTEGAPLAGNFQEGQVLEEPITIMPGRCYTFIAAGVGPQEIEIQLVAQTPIPALAPMMGDQKAAGGKVVLGKGSACIKLAIIPIAVPAKWVIKAVQGRRRHRRAGVLEVGSASCPSPSPLSSASRSAPSSPGSPRRSSRASTGPSSPRGPSWSWRRSRGSCGCPSSGYFVAFHGDWSYLYVVPWQRVPSAVDLGLVLLAGAAVVGGFWLAVRPVRKRRSGPSSRWSWRPRRSPLPG